MFSLDGVMVGGVGHRAEAVRPRRYRGGRDGGETWGFGDSPGFKTGDEESQRVVIVETLVPVIGVGHCTCWLTRSLM